MFLKYQLRTNCHTAKKPIIFMLLPLTPVHMYSIITRKLPVKGAAMKDLTPRQKAVLDVITTTIESRGFPPTIREIAEMLEISSPNGVNDHLKALEKKGYIERSGNKSRGLRLVYTSPEFSPFGYEEAVSVPLVGQVAAGSPLLAEENISETYNFDRNLLGGRDDLFALRIKGDSMTEAGIDNGDLVFVHQQSSADNGRIVVAMINGEATVKFLHRDAHGIELRPANARYSPIKINADDGAEISILGVVTHCFKKFD